MQNLCRSLLMALHSPVTLTTSRNCQNKFAPIVYLGHFHPRSLHPERRSLVESRVQCETRNVQIATGVSLLHSLMFPLFPSVCHALKRVKARRRPLKPGQHIPSVAAPLSDDGHLSRFADRLTGATRQTAFVECLLPLASWRGCGAETT